MKNKGMFYTGLGLLVSEILIGIFSILYTLTKNISVNEGTVQMLALGLLFTLLTVLSIILMVVGSKED